MCVRALPPIPKEVFAAMNRRLALVTGATSLIPLALGMVWPAQAAGSTEINRKLLRDPTSTWSPGVEILQAAPSPAQ
jgi:hypothetical protein